VLTTILVRTNSDCRREHHACIQIKSNIASYTNSLMVSDCQCRLWDLFR